MDVQKIQKIEKELESLYCDSDDIGKERRELLKGFWHNHIIPVAKLSKEMAEKYGADKETVWLGALFHDIALFDGSEPHEELGAVIAKEFLLSHGFDADVAEKVSDIVLTHRCKKFLPETAEEKIIATADAVAHFLPAFYLGIAVVAKDDYKEMMNTSFEKLEMDFDKKIFFPDEKKMLHARMQDFRKWVLYK